MDNKRAQGLSLNTIIIAAIVLIVLIVLWAIFTGRMGGFAKEVAVCRGEWKLRGKCVYPTGTIDAQVEPRSSIGRDTQGDPTLTSTRTSDEEVCCILLT